MKYDLVISDLQGQLDWLENKPAKFFFADHGRFIIKDIGNSQFEKVDPDSIEFGLAEAYLRGRSKAQREYPIPEC